jgi:malic enzyme
MGDKRTFSSTVKLDPDLLVHVLGQVENVFLFGLLLLLLLSTATSTATFSMSATAARSIITSAAVAATSTERASFGHGLAKPEISEYGQMKTVVLSVVGSQNPGYVIERMRYREGSGEESEPAVTVGGKGRSHSVHGHSPTV